MQHMSRRLSPLWLGFITLCLANPLAAAVPDAKKQDKTAKPSPGKRKPSGPQRPVGPSSLAAARYPLEGTWSVEMEGARTIRGRLTIGAAEGKSFASEMVLNMPGGWSVRQDCTTTADGTAVMVECFQSEVTGARQRYEPDLFRLSFVNEHTLAGNSIDMTGGSIDAVMRRQ